MVFTDHAAARAFEYGVEHAEVVAALEGGRHFRQAGYERGQFNYYVRLDNRPFKIVTGIHQTMPDTTAIITLVPLDLE